MAQSDQILAALLRGEKITPLEALYKYGCFRLGARIWDLRQAGHKIKSETHVTPDGKRVAVYSYDYDVPVGTNYSLLIK